ncbi:unnamed protein product [Brachionus calyciflorus]|uniref:G-protein coupled receptors family 1 profile domain-containing protein n=1 Tax=Brachionus calyciflorus TaxID=104777 RepID=A0A813Q6V9_9BILA|nr:unnamed protein product [Brachionus calyciflorus]
MNLTMAEEFVQAQAIDYFEKIVSFLPLVLIFIGTIGNISCFFIFRFSSQFKKIPSMVFLSIVAVTDTTSLFVWNLNYFLEPNFNTILENLSIFNCKFFSFIQEFSIQSSSNILGIMCIDRFFSIISTPGSIYSKLPFASVKSSYLWIIAVMLVILSINLHFLITNGNYSHIESTNLTLTELINGTINNYSYSQREEEICFWYSSDFNIYPLWDQISIIIYNVIPFTIMLIFNTLLIAKTILINKSIKKIKNRETLRAIKRKRRLTISILSITFAFIVLTLPASIAYGFFLNYFNSMGSRGKAFLHLLDFFGFFFHSSLFINCFITNIKFRKYVLTKIRRLFKINKKSPNENSNSII